eukprot:6125767-Prymnesium_polylepis.1
MAKRHSRTRISVDCTAANDVAPPPPSPTKSSAGAHATLAKLKASKPQEALGPALDLIHLQGDADPGMWKDVGIGQTEVVAPSLVDNIQSSVKLERAK